MNLEISTTNKFTNEEVSDLLCCAFEGGIGYWAILDNTTADWREARKEVRLKSGGGFTFEDVAIAVLENGKSIHLIDAEDDEEVYSFNKEDFENGIRMAIENKYWDGNVDTADAETGDVIIQYACFGEIVFG